MTKNELLTEYERLSGADFFGLAIESGGALRLAVIARADVITVLNAVCGSVEQGSKGNGLRVRYNMTVKHTAIIEQYAVKSYALPFTVADIEAAYIAEKAANGGKQGKRNRGSLFEDWTATALNAERNARQNEAFTNSGDLRINGYDIQVKYDRGAVALPK